MADVRTFFWASTLPPSNSQMPKSTRAFPSGDRPPSTRARRPRKKGRNVGSDPFTADQTNKMLAAIVDANPWGRKYREKTKAWQEAVDTLNDSGFFPENLSVTNLRDKVWACVESVRFYLLWIYYDWDCWWLKTLIAWIPPISHNLLLKWRCDLWLANRCCPWVDWRRGEAQGWEKATDEQGMKFPSIKFFRVNLDYILIVGTCSEGAPRLNCPQRSSNDMGWYRRRRWQQPHTSWTTRRCPGVTTRLTCNLAEWHAPIHARHSQVWRWAECYPIGITARKPSRGGTIWAAFGYPNWPAKDHCWVCGTHGCSRASSSWVKPFN